MRLERDAKNFSRDSHATIHAFGAARLTSSDFDKKKKNKPTVLQSIVNPFTPKI